MVRFLLRRMGFTAIVCVGIVILISLGMRLAAISHSARPSYDL